MNAIIKIKNLTVLYDKGMQSEVKALNGINLEIYPNEFLIIFGPSGCGKSTLLYVMAGIEKNIEKTSEVWVKDKNLVTMSKGELVLFHRKQMGMVFQAFNLISNLTVLQNVALPMIFSGAPKKERNKKAKIMLNKLSISQYAERFPQQLSGGQQQRVGIARALVNESDIILADEPTGNLDSENAVNVLKMLQRLNKEEGKTIIMVTHEAQYIPFATRIVYLKDGKILREEKIEQQDDIQKEEEQEELKKEDVEKNIETETEEEKLDEWEKEIFRKKVEENGQTERAPRNNLFLLTDFCQFQKINEDNLLSYFGFTFNFEEKTRLLSAVNNFFESKISKKDLMYLLDLSFKDGGVGLYSRKAESFSDEVEKIKFLTESLRFKLEHKKEDLGVIAKYIISWAFSDYKGEEFREAQYNRIYDFVLKRIKGELTSDELFKALDQSFIIDGGAGLNFRTAKNFVQKLDMLLKA